MGVAFSSLFATIIGLQATPHKCESMGGFSFMENIKTIVPRTKLGRLYVERLEAK